VARITRKELKTDKFALEVEQTFTFFEEHRQDLFRYGGAALVVIVLGAGLWLYRGNQHTAREAALGRALQVQEAAVGPPAPGATTISAFPTAQVKDEAATKVFADLKSKYSGSDEADIANFYLGTIQTDQGKLAEAEKSFQEVASKGDANYASLAKLSLGEIYIAQGKVDQGQKMLEDLASHPTIFVSKEQAQLALARALSPTKPAEARKILDTLRTIPGPVGQVAIQMYVALPPS
jgi:predicted negative regulator of RcsB-dependent stress response